MVLLDRQPVDGNTWYIAGLIEHPRLWLADHRHRRILFTVASSNAFILA
jgi:hypothetical protein